MKFNAAFSTIKHGLLLFVVVISLYPVWFMLQSSLKTDNQYQTNPLGLPIPPSGGGYHSLFVDLPVLRWLMNSVIVSVTTAAGSTFIALLASFAIVFSRMHAAKGILLSNIACMVIPPVTLLGPLFVTMVDVGLINKLPSVILIYTGLFLPFSVFFLVNFLATIPRELIEAGMVDGLGPFGLLLRIVTPLISPALFTLVLVNIIYGWNELLIALVFLQNDHSRTLMAGLTLFQGRYTAQVPLVMSGAFFSILPVLALYIFGQRYFVRGLTAGIGK